MKKYFLFVALIAFCTACTSSIDGMEWKHIEISPNIIEVGAEGGIFQLTSKEGMPPFNGISEYLYCNDWKTISIWAYTPGYRWWGENKLIKEGNEMIQYVKNPYDDTECISITFKKKEDGNYDYTQATFTISPNNTGTKRCYHASFSGAYIDSSIRILQNEK